MVSQAAMREGQPQISPPLPINQFRPLFPALAPLAASLLCARRPFAVADADATTLVPSHHQSLCYLHRSFLAVKQLSHSLLLSPRRLVPVARVQLSARLLCQRHSSLTPSQCTTSPKFAPSLPTSCVRPCSSVPSLLCCSYSPSPRCATSALAAVCAH
jgi:hypothetical protein